MTKIFKRLANHRHGAFLGRLYKAAVLVPLVLMALIRFNPYHALVDPSSSSLPSREVSTKSKLTTSKIKGVGGGGDKIYFRRFGEEPVPGPLCTDPHGRECQKIDSLTTTTLKGVGKQMYTCDHGNGGSGKCSKHATCFFGTCLCHPGYEGPHCDQKMEWRMANPWYTLDCPNLHDDNTLDVNRTKLGGGLGCPDSDGADLGTGLSYCAYLCYSNEMYGSAIVPHALWAKAQQAENGLWSKTRGHNDRYKDHFAGFANYQCLPLKLGHVIEFGAGPWTQIRGLLHKRPDVQVDSYTILEPGANYYIENVSSCVYKTGQLVQFPDWKKVHDFPVFIRSDLGESAMTRDYQFDTVLAVNVIEHVQNAVEFLHGIHKSLKPGGLLIFHDRYYMAPEDGDDVLGRNVFHPIRLTQPFFDHFLSDFDIIFNNCDGEKTIQGWIRRNKGERGYYVIARKKRQRTSTDHTAGSIMIPW